MAIIDNCVTFLAETEPLKLTFRLTEVCLSVWQL